MTSLVATFCRATDKLCLHGVSLLYTCVESAYRVERGAPGRHVAHVISLPLKPLQLTRTFFFALNDCAIRSHNCNGTKRPTLCIVPYTRYLYRHKNHYTLSTHTAKVPEASRLELVEPLRLSVKPLCNNPNAIRLANCYSKATDRAMMM